MILRNRDYRLDTRSNDGLTAQEKIEWVISCMLKEYLRTGINEFTKRELLTLTGYKNKRLKNTLHKMVALGLIEYDDKIKINLKNVRKMFV